MILRSKLLLIEDNNDMRENTAEILDCLFMNFRAVPHFRSRHHRGFLVIVIFHEVKDGNAHFVAPFISSVLAFKHANSDNYKIRGCPR